jgi:hypothetical protein
MIFVYLNSKQANQESNTNTEEIIQIPDENTKITEENNILNIVRIQYVAHILTYSNYCVNISFYIIWSQKYREEFFKLFGITNRKSHNHEMKNNVELKILNTKLNKIS